jgi:hypothetical protein
MLASARSSTLSLSGKNLPAPDHDSACPASARIDKVGDKAEAPKYRSSGEHCTLVQVCNVPWAHREGQPVIYAAPPPGQGTPACSQWSPRSGKAPNSTAGWNALRASVAVVLRRGIALSLPFSDRLHAPEVTRSPIRPSSAFESWKAFDSCGKVLLHGARPVGALRFWVRLEGL